MTKSLKNSKIKIAAPFVGEFGWETSMRTPWLRYKSQQYRDNSQLIVICQKGHAGLYRDFAGGIIEHDFSNDIEKVDCQYAWMRGKRVGHLEYLHIVEGIMDKRIDKRQMVDPTRMPYYWRDGPPRLGKEAKYYPYSANSHRGDHVVVHARNCKDKQPERNWGPEEWGALMAFIKPGIDQEVISVGSTDGARHIIGSVDKRGQTLDELIKTISTAKFVVGPSSGPLALALQCDTPVVWWSANDKDLSRFESHWNPYMTETTRAAKSWSPDVGEVASACVKYL